jgi:DNA-binding PadR family transcriptional regulator
MQMTRPHCAGAQLPEHAYVILGYVALHTDGVHGYQIGRLLLRSPLGLPLLGLGQLYRVLHQLEGVGFITGTIEINGAARARYRFTMTRKGGTAFRQWLVGGSRGAAPVRDQLLNRLRFAEQVPQPALRRLVAEAVKECEGELGDLKRERSVQATDGFVTPLHSLALQARLVAYQRWLAEVGDLLESGAAARTVEARRAGNGS